MRLFTTVPIGGVSLRVLGYLSTERLLIKLWHGTGSGFC